MRGGGGPVRHSREPLVQRWCSSPRSVQLDRAGLSSQGETAEGREGGREGGRRDGREG